MTYIIFAPEDTRPMSRLEKGGTDGDRRPGTGDRGPGTGELILLGALKKFLPFAPSPLRGEGGVGVNVIHFPLRVI